MDGIVFSTSRATAVKVYAGPERFERELAVYRRLQSHSVKSVGGFAVPQLIGFSAELQIVEMSIVRPPFILDFAGSFLDQSPDFEPEAIEHWQAEKREEFGKHFSVAISLFEELRRRYGIYAWDLSPRNVQFAGDEAD